MVSLDLLDGVERAPGGGRILLVQQPRRAGLHQDHVDRVAGRVVQLPGDPGALLGGGEPALPFGVALGAPGAFLQLGELVATQPGPVTGDIRPGEQQRGEQQLGKELVERQRGRRGRSGQVDGRGQHRGPAAHRPRIPAVRDGQVVTPTSGPNGKS